LYESPAIAVSLALSRSRPDYQSAAVFTARLADSVLRLGLPPGVFLNLNFPASRPIGVKITRQGSKIVQSMIAEKSDPRGKKYYWIGEDQSEWGGEPDTDYFAVKNGYVSITPLQRDQTAHAVLTVLDHLSLPLHGVAAEEAQPAAAPNDVHKPRRKAGGG
jgi:5'-nucleotidase